MDGMLTLDYVHKVIGKIKNEIVNNYDFISDVIIHANPHWYIVNFYFNMLY